MLSPQVLRKRNAIFKHQSQKDRAVFPGDDAREFWVRAEDRNRETAQAYDRLGLAECARLWKHSTEFYLTPKPALPSDAIAMKEYPKDTFFCIAL